MSINITYHDLLLTQDLIEMYSGELKSWYEIWKILEASNSNVHQRHYFLSHEQIHRLSNELVSLRKLLKKEGVNYSTHTFKLNEIKKRIKAAASRELRENKKRNQIYNELRPEIEKHKELLKSLRHPHPAFEDIKSLWDYVLYTGKYHYGLSVAKDPEGYNRMLDDPFRF